MNNVAVLHQGAIDYTGKQLDLIRRTVASDCNQIEFDLFLEVARRVGLDPFRKQIYAVVYSKDNAEKRKMSIITGIDGYRAVAARNRDYRPDDAAPAFEYSETAKNPDLNPLGILSCAVKCWKYGPDGVWYPIVGVAYWDEFAPITEVWAYDENAKKRKPTGVFELDKRGKWYTMGRVMIAKAAEAICLRKGWPETLSGVYTEDEMARSFVQDMTATEAADKYETEKRLQLVNAADCITVQWSPADPLEAVPAGKFADRAAAFVRECKTVPDLDGWRETNRVALNNFWARSKSDALELKKVIEARIETLAKEARVPEGNGLLV